MDIKKESMYVIYTVNWKVVEMSKRKLKRNVGKHVQLYIRRPFYFEMYVCTHTHTLIYVYMYACADIYTYVHIYILFDHLSFYENMYIYLCVCVYMYMHINI